MFKDGVLDFVADIVDELIGVLKSTRTVERDQTFSGRKFSDLVFDRNGEVAGDRGDHDQIIFIKVFQKLSVGGGVGGDPDELTDGDQLLLEDLAWEGRVFSCYQYHILCVHEHIDELIKTSH